MRYILLFVIVATIISCKKNPSMLISAGEYKYWQVTKDPIEKGKAIYFYYFDKNGKWLVFQRGYNNEFSKLDRGDVFFIETWKLINDTTIDIGGKHCYIERITESEFVFTDKNGLRKELLAVPNSLVPEEYRKLQR